MPWRKLHDRCVWIWYVWLQHGLSVDRSYNNILRHKEYKMRDIGYIVIYALVILWLTGCSAKFDSFDPTTTTLRWIITHEKK